MTSAPPIDFFCAICGANLLVGAEHGGGFVECPSCTRMVPVPGELSTGNASGPAFGKDVISVEMSFLCPGCDRELLADARLEGKDFECPKCGATGSIPRWSARPRVDDDRRVAVLTPAEVEFLSRGLENSPPSAAPEAA